MTTHSASSLAEMADEMERRGNECMARAVHCRTAKERELAATRQRVWHEAAALVRATTLTTENEHGK